MGREEQVRDAKCTRPSLPVEGLAPRLLISLVPSLLGTRSRLDPHQRRCLLPRGWKEQVKNVCVCVCVSVLYVCFMLQLSYV